MVAIQKNAVYPKTARRQVELPFSCRVPDNSPLFVRLHRAERRMAPKELAISNLFRTSDSTCSLAVLCIIAPRSPVLGKKQKATRQQRKPKDGTNNQPRSLDQAYNH